MPDIKERFAALGMEAASNTPISSRRHQGRDRQSSAKIAKAAGVKPRIAVC